MTPGAIPVFFQPNLATGKPVTLPAGARTVGHERLLPAPAAPKTAAPSGDLEARLKEAERRLAVSKAWDGAENMNSAYGDYLDDLDFGAARQAVRAERPQGGAVQRHLRRARAHRRPRRHVAAARIASAHVDPHPLADAAGDPRRRGWTLRVDPLASLPGGLEPDPRARASTAACTTIRSSSKTACGSCGASTSTNSIFQSPTYEGGWSAAKDPAPAASPRPAAPNPQTTTIRRTSRSPSWVSASAGFRGGPGDDDRLARHSADVVPLQEPGQRTRPRVLLAGLRVVHAAPRNQHEEPRLPAAAVLETTDN